MFEEKTYGLIGRDFYVFNLKVDSDRKWKNIIDKKKDLEVVKEHCDLIYCKKEFNEIENVIKDYEDLKKLIFIDISNISNGQKQEERKEKEDLISIIITKGIDKRQIVHLKKKKKEKIRKVRK